MPALLLALRQELRAARHWAEPGGCLGYWAWGGEGTFLPPSTQHPRDPLGCGCHRLALVQVSALQWCQEASAVGSSSPRSLQNRKPRSWPLEEPSEGDARDATNSCGMAARRHGPHLCPALRSCLGCAQPCLLPAFLAHPPLPRCYAGGRIPLPRGLFQGESSTHPWQWPWELGNRRG